MKLPLIENNKRLISENIFELKNKYQNKFVLKNFIPTKKSPIILKKDNIEELSNDKLELKNKLKRVSSISYLNSKNNKIIKKKIKIRNINNDIFELNSDNIINNFSDNIKTRPFINDKSIKKYKDKDKLIYISQEIKNKLNFSSVNKDNKIHEYNIKFNNAFWKNISWNNNILKNIFKRSLNKGKEKNEEKENSINCKNMKSFDKEKDKDKEKKNLRIFKNINNDYINSYFYSEINNFYNNYKNNKIILSKLEKKNMSNNKKIYTSPFNENIYYNNHCVSELINNNKNNISFHKDKS